MYPALVRAGGGGTWNWVVDFIDERFASAPMRAERDWDQADWILPPVTRKVACEIIDAQMKLRYFRAIGNARGQYRGGDLFAKCHPIAFLLVAIDAQKVVRQFLVKGGLLRRIKGNESVMRRLCHGCHWSKRDAGPSRFRCSSDIPPKWR